MQYIKYFGHGLHQLIYVSQATELMNGSTELDRIVEQSNVRNHAKALTGALLVYGDAFVQVLEGGHSSLEALFRTLEADPRHKNVTLKGVEGIDQRMFGRWGMREGWVAAGAAPMDIAHMDYKGLRSLLRLSVKSSARKAA